MTAIQVTLLVIVVIEFLSVLELYFMQDKAVFNGVAIFSGWEISKEVAEVHEMVRYLVNWIAGIKLIVIGLLLVLVLTAPEQSLVYAGIAMVIAVSSFFWRLLPAIRKLDQAGSIQPAGRSQMLGWMVIGLEAMLVLSLIIELIGF